VVAYFFGHPVHSFINGKVFGDVINRCNRSEYTPGRPVIILA